MAGSPSHKKAIMYKFNLVEVICDVCCGTCVYICVQCAVCGLCGEFGGFYMCDRYHEYTVCVLHSMCSVLYVWDE